MAAKLGIRFGPDQQVTGCRRLGRSMAPDAAFDARYHHRVLVLARQFGVACGVGLGVTVAAIDIAMRGVIVDSVCQPAAGNQWRRIGVAGRHDRLVTFDQAFFVALQALLLEHLSRLFQVGLLPLIDQLL